MAESKTPKIFAVVLISLAVLALLLPVGAWLLLDRMGNLFTVPQSALTYVSVADWSGQSFEDVDEVTLLIGEASDKTQDAWAYRAILDPAALESEELRFGYHAGFFERITSIPASSGCTVNGKPRGRSITLSIDTKVVQRRSNCRLSTLDLDVLWQRAVPVTLHDARLTEEEHRVRLEALKSDTSVRIIGFDANYGAYDKMIRIVLPTLWGPRAEEWEHRVDSQLESAIRAAVGENENSMMIQFEPTIAEGSTVPARPMPNSTDDPFDGYAISGESGRRMVRDLDILTQNIFITCEARACDAVHQIDFDALIAPFRDMNLLMNAYDRAPPATGDHNVMLNLATLRQEKVLVRPPQDIRYSLSWIDNP